MISEKLLWTGLTIIVGLGHYVPHADIVGGIIMTIGLLILLFGSKE